MNTLESIVEDVNKNNIFKDLVLRDTSSTKVNPPTNYAESDHGISVLEDQDVGLFNHFAFWSEEGKEA